MKLLMDADCLIKLTKAGLKELIAENTTISIPAIVKYEVVDAGKIKGCSDAFAVEKSIALGLIDIIESPYAYKKGDYALMELFQKAKFDAVATDDKKLIRHLQAQEVRFILPGLILYRLQEKGRMDLTTALWALDRLAPFISEDEFSITKLLLEKTK